MKLIIQIDGAGWFAGDPALSPPRWQSVTCDEMFLQRTPMQPGFPALADLPAVRRHQRNAVRARNGALISCDVISVCGRPAVRTISKYRTTRARAMSFSAALTLPLTNWIVEILISGAEDSLTGVREAIVTSELIRTAGRSEKEQLARNVIPIQWQFERYQPGSRTDLSYALPDDPKYDMRFPDHPLSRVRRWLRRQEKVFQVLAEDTPVSANGGGVWNPRRIFRPAERPDFEVRLQPFHVSSIEDLQRELGSQVAADMIAPEALAKLDPPMPLPPLSTRQKVFLDQREASVKTMFEAHRQREAETRKAVQDAEALMKQPGIDAAYVALARERSSGQWHTLSEGAQSNVLAVFTSPAAADDFILAKRLECEPVAMTLKDLFIAVFGLQAGPITIFGLNAGPITALEFDRCPRCTDVRPVVQFSAIPTLEGLLKQYGVHIASRKILVEKNIRVAANEPDLRKRLAVLRYTAEHIDCGAAVIYIEMAKLAQESGDAALLAVTKRILGKYFPEVSNPEKGD